MLFFVVITFFFNYISKVIKIQIGATKGLVQHMLQRIWAIVLMGSWFCVWNDLANPKNGLNLVPNPL
jgi:hypothetical protein